MTGEAKRLARFFAQQLRVTRLSSRYIATVMKRPGSRRLAMRDVMRHGELVAPADAIDLALDVDALSRCKQGDPGGASR